MKSLAMLLLWFPLQAETVTYAKQIGPVLLERCASCHRPGEAAPFPLLTYEDARKHAAQIVRVTALRFMPPWLPIPGHGDFAGAGRLSAEQIAWFASWLKQGTPLGDPAQIPKPPHFPEGWQLGPPDLVLHLRQRFPLKTKPGDVFRNFVLPVNLTETKYVRAMELRPSNKRVVHHANLIVDRARMLRKRDGEDGQPGFEGMEVVTEASGQFEPDSHFLFWKPGTQAQETPEDMAWKPDPGSDLIVNLHLQPSGKPELVDVDVGLYFARQPPQRFPMLVPLEHDGAIVLQLHQHGETLGRLAGKVQPHIDVDELRFAGWLQVEIDDEIRAGIELPRHVFRRFLSLRARFPEQKMGVRLELAGGFGDDLHPFKSGLAIFAVALAQHPCVIDDQVRVMNHAFVAGPQFHGAHVFGFSQIHRQYEVPKNVARFRFQREPLAQVQHEVRRPELPALGEVRRLGNPGGVTQRRALLQPTRKPGDLFRRQPPRAGEVAVAGNRQPGRHETKCGDAHDLGRMLARVFVGQQGERGGFARTVAACATL